MILIHMETESFLLNPTYSTGRKAWDSLEVSSGKQSYNSTLFLLNFCTGCPCISQLYKVYRELACFGELPYMQIFDKYFWRQQRIAGKTQECSPKKQISWIWTFTNRGLELMYRKKRFVYWELLSIYGM